MPETAANPDSQRNIVSYFDHEFLGPSEARSENDIDEMIQSGFTNVVVCVTESDIASPQRQAHLISLTSRMKERGLTVWADPWAVGSVFGGEGHSDFREGGGLSCYCNPELDTLIKNWIDTVAQMNIETIFWDEPEMKHDIHRRDELKFIERYAAYASQSGLENVVCLCANYEKADQLEELAQSSHVAEIATDPYWPYVFKKIAPLDRKAHVAYWADYTREVAEANDKRHHVWVQNFGIPAGQESIIAEHVEIVQRHAGSIALWGFHGCEAVPGFQKVGQLKPREAWALSRSAIARQAIV